MNESFRAMRGGRGGGPGGRRGRRRGGFGGPPPAGPGGTEGQASGKGYELDPLTGMGEERFPLRSKLLANPTLKTRYLQFVRQIAREQIAWEKMKPLVSQAKDLIESEVKADTRKLVTFDAFAKATDLDSPTKASSLREFAEKRSAYLLDHPAIKELPEAMVELPANATKEK